MMSRIAAIPGQWYLDRESGQVFQVVGLDEEEGSIEIQYADGSLEEQSLEDWGGKRLEVCDQPEDWVGPYDDLQSDEIGLPESEAEPHGAELPMERALLDIEAGRALPMGNTEE